MIKGSRRRLVSDQHRVLLCLLEITLVILLMQKITFELQKKERDSPDYSEYWGNKWFMLQNIAYGDWEGSLYNFDYSLSQMRCMQDSLKFFATIKITI